MNCPNKVLTDLDVRVLTEQDSDRILQFMADHYSDQHPLRQTFGVGKERAVAFDRIRIQAKIPDGVSLGGFVKETDELVYVEMNSILNRSGCTPAEPPIIDMTAEEKALDTFVDLIEGDIFKNLKAEQIFWVSMVAVAKSYRGLGLSYASIVKRESLAASRDCDYLATTASSNFSQRAMLKQGFTILRKTKHCDYVDTRTGTKPELKLSPIHTFAVVLYKRVKKPEVLSGKE